MAPAAPRTARSFLGPPPAAAPAPTSNAGASAASAALSPPSPAEMALSAAQAKAGGTDGQEEPQTEQPGSSTPGVSAPSPQILHSSNLARQATRKGSRSRSRTPETPLRRSPRRSPRRHSPHNEIGKPAAATAEPSTHGASSSKSPAPRKVPAPAPGTTGATAPTQSHNPPVSTKAAALAADAARAAAAARGEGPPLPAVSPLRSRVAKETAHPGVIVTPLPKSGSLSSTARAPATASKQGDETALRRTGSGTTVKFSGQNVESTASGHGTTSPIRRNAISKASRFSSATVIAPKSVAAPDPATEDAMSKNPEASTSGNSASTSAPPTVSRRLTSGTKPLIPKPRGMVKVSNGRIVQVESPARRSSNDRPVEKASSAATLNQATALTAKSSVSTPTDWPRARAVPGSKVASSTSAKEAPATSISQKDNSVRSEGVNDGSTAVMKEQRHAPAAGPSDLSDHGARAPNVIIPPDAPIPRTSVRADAPPTSQAPHVIIPPSSPIPRSRGQPSPAGPSPPPPPPPQVRTIPGRGRGRGRGRGPTARRLSRGGGIRTDQRPSPPSSAVPTGHSPSSVPSTAVPQTPPRPTPSPSVNRSPVNIPLVAQPSVPRDPRVRPNIMRAAAAKGEAAKAASSAAPAVSKAQGDRQPVAEAQRTTAPPAPAPAPAPVAAPTANRPSPAPAASGRITCESSVAIMKDVTPPGAALVPGQQQPLSADALARKERDRRLHGRRSAGTPTGPVRRTKTAIPAQLRSRVRGGSVPSPSANRSDVTAAAAVAGTSGIISAPSQSPNQGAQPLATKSTQPPPPPHLPPSQSLTPPQRAKAIENQQSAAPPAQPQRSQPTQPSMSGQPASSSQSQPPAVRQAAKVPAAKAPNPASAPPRAQVMGQRQSQHQTRPQAPPPVLNRQLQAHPQQPAPASALSNGQLQAHQQQQASASAVSNRQLQSQLHQQTSGSAFPQRQLQSHVQQQVSSSALSNQQLQAHARPQAPASVLSNQQLQSHAQQQVPMSALSSRQPQSYLQQQAPSALPNRQLQAHAQQQAPPVLSNRRLQAHLQQQAPPSVLSNRQWQAHLEQQAHRSVLLNQQLQVQQQQQHPPSVLTSQQLQVRSQQQASSSAFLNRQLQLNQQLQAQAQQQAQSHLQLKMTQAKPQAQAQPISQQQYQSSNPAVIGRPPNAQWRTVQQAAHIAPNIGQQSMPPRSQSGAPGIPTSTVGATATPGSAPVSGAVARYSSPMLATAAVPIVAAGTPSPAKTPAPASTTAAAANSAVVAARDGTPAFSVGRNQPPAYRGRGTGRPRGRPRGSKAKITTRSRGRPRGAKTRASAVRASAQSSPLGSASSSTADSDGAGTDTDVAAKNAPGKSAAGPSGSADKPKRGRPKGLTKKQKEKLAEEKEKQRIRQIELDKEARLKMEAHLARRKSWTSGFGSNRPEPDASEPAPKRHRSLSPPRNQSQPSSQLASGAVTHAGSSSQAGPSSGPASEPPRRQSLPFVFQKINPVAISATKPPRASQKFSISRLSNLSLALSAPPALAPSSLLSVQGPGRISVNVAPKPPQPPQSSRFSIISPARVGLAIPPRPRVIASPAKLSFSRTPVPAPPRTILRPEQLAIGRHPSPGHNYRAVDSLSRLAFQRAPTPQPPPRSNAWSVVNVAVEQSVNVTPMSAKTPRADSQSLPLPGSVNIAPAAKRLEFEEEVSHQQAQTPAKTLTKRSSRALSAVPESEEPAVRSSQDMDSAEDGIIVVDVPDGRIPRIRLGASQGVSKSVRRGTFNRMGTTRTTGLRSQPADIESQGNAARGSNSAAAANSPAARHAAIQRSQAVREGVARDRAERERAEKAMQTMAARHQSQGAATDMYALTRKPRVIPPFEAMMERQMAAPMSSMNLYDRIKAKNAVRAGASSSPAGSKRPYSKMSSPSQTPKSPGSKRPRSSPRKTPAQIASAAVANSSRRHAPGSSAAHEELRELTPKQRTPRSSVSPDSAVGEGVAGVSSRGASVGPANGGSTSVGPAVEQVEEDNSVADHGANGNVPDEDFVPEVFGCLCDAPVNEVPDDVIQELNDDPDHGGLLPINFWRWRLLVHHYICTNANKPTACPRRKAQLEAFAGLPFTTMLQSADDA